MVIAFAAHETTGAGVGVWDGDFSALLMEFIAPKELHLIDIQFREQLKIRLLSGHLLGHLSGPVITVREGESSKVLSTYPDEFFDWIYLDGDHSYDGVKSNAAVSIKKIKRDGALFFNNYKMGDHNHPDGFYPYGIIEVVNNLCLYDGFEMVGFGLHPQMYCDVAIRRRA
jgi:hypothetical protein